MTAIIPVQLEHNHDKVDRKQYKYNSGELSRREYVNIKQPEIPCFKILRWTTDINAWLKVHENHAHDTNLAALLM